MCSFGVKEPEPWNFDTIFQIMYGSVKSVNERIAHDIFHVRLCSLWVPLYDEQKFDVIWLETLELLSCPRQQAIKVLLLSFPSHQK